MSSSHTLSTDRPHDQLPHGSSLESVLKTGVAMCGSLSFKAKPKGHLFIPDKFFNGHLVSFMAKLDS